MNELIDVHRPQINILMATYNGEKYIIEQIDSILHQTYQNFKLFIRDDNSSDNTTTIIKNYCAEDGRVVFIEDGLGNVGQCRNFDILMQNVMLNEGYFMFSDQDDIWERNKIELTLSKMIEAESKTKHTSPILVYTNYKVSYEDKHKQELAYNYRFAYDDKEYTSRLLVQSWIMGCTVMINKSLLKISINIPEAADNHDNWISKICSLTGKVYYIHDQTMTHRIHSSNVTTNSKTKLTHRRLQRLFTSFVKSKAQIQKRIILNTILLERVSPFMRPDMITLSKMYGDILCKPIKKTLVSAIKNKFYAFTPISTLVFYAQLIFK